MDCFVAEFIIGPAEGGTRWLLAMTRKAPASRRPAGSIRARVLICRHGKSNPGIWAAANQPDGQITKSLSSLSGKNSSLLLSGKSALGLPPSRPTRGAIARRHERGAGCGGRGSVRRANASRTNDADAYGQVVWF